MKRTLLPDESESPAAGASRSSDPKSPSLEIIKSQDVFGGRRELLIEHAGSLYRLRITQNNKLILTK